MRIRLGFFFSPHNPIVSVFKLPHWFLPSNWWETPLWANQKLILSQTGSCYSLSEWACISLFRFFQRKETLIYNEELSIIFTLWAVIFRWDCQEVSVGKIGKIQGYEPWKEGGWRAESGPCPKKVIRARVSCNQGMRLWKQQDSAKAKDLNLSICGRVTMWLACS